MDRSSTPRHQPTATPDEVVAQVEVLRRAHKWSAARRITPYTPRHNGKVERYNRILAEEFLYARTWASEQQRTEALEVWNVHYNYHRPHTAVENRPPAAQLRRGVTNVMASYI